jgi:hypothetical protein
MSGTASNHCFFRGSPTYISFAAVLGWYGSRMGADDLWVLPNVGSSCLFTVRRKFSPMIRKPPPGVSTRRPDWLTPRADRRFFLTWGLLPPVNQHRAFRGPNNTGTVTCGSVAPRGRREDADGRSRRSGRQRSRSHNVRPRRSRAPSRRHAGRIPCSPRARACDRRRPS